MEDSFRPHLPRVLQHVQRADDVRVHVGNGRDIRIRNRNQGREMKDDLAVLHRVLHAAAIGDVSSHDLDLRLERRRIEPTPTAERVVMHERPHVRAQFHEPFREMAPNKAARARYEHSLA